MTPAGVQLALSLLQDGAPLTGETAAFVHLTYVQYNRLVRGALRYDEKTREVTVTNFAQLAGNELLWRLVMRAASRDVEALIGAVYANNVAALVRDGIAAFVAAPSDVGSRTLIGLLNARRPRPVRVAPASAGPEERAIAVAVTFRVGERVALPTLEVRSALPMFLASAETKATNHLVQDALATIERTRAAFDPVKELRPFTASPSDRVDQVVGDALEEFLKTPAEQLALATAQEWVRAGTYAPWIAAYDVPVADVSRRMQEFVRNDRVELTVRLEEGAAPLRPPARTPAAQPPAEFVTPAVEPVCAEEDVVRLVPVLDDPSLRMNVVDIIRALDPFVRWEGDPLDVALADGPRRTLGIVRLESAPAPLTEEQFRRLLAAFAALLREQSPLAEMTAAVLVKNDA